MEAVRENRLLSEVVCLSDAFDAIDLFLLDLRSNSLNPSLPRRLTLFDQTLKVGLAEGLGLSSLFLLLCVLSLQDFTHAHGFNSSGRGVIGL